eukprot:619349-Pelagomonas_calceolata.AAC.1
MAGHRNGQPVAEVDSQCFAESSWGEIHNTILKPFTKCGMAPFQSNWFRATMRFYNSLTKCKSPP